MKAQNKKLNQDFPCNRKIKGENKVKSRRNVRRKLNRQVPKDS